MNGNAERVPVEVTFEGPQLSPFRSCADERSRCGLLTRPGGWLVSLFLVESEAIDR